MTYRVRVFFLIEIYSLIWVSKSIFGQTGTKFLLFLGFSAYFFCYCIVEIVEKDLVVEVF